jgi:hypothetical protein
MNPTHWLGACFALFCLVLGPEVAYSQNLVANPGFDSGVTGWQGSGLVWDNTRDASGALTSGSARALASYEPIGVLECSSSIRQVLSNVRGGTTYAFGGRTFVAPGQVLGSSWTVSWVRVMWYGDTQCSAVLGRNDASASDGEGAWATSTAPLVMAPQQTVCAAIEGYACTYLLGANIRANFDDMYMRAATVEGVPMLGGRARIALGVLLACVGWCLAKRST